MTAARAMRERKARRYLRSRIRARRPLSWAVMVIVVMRDCRRVFFLMVWVVREEEKEEVWTWEVVLRVSEFGRVNGSVGTRTSPRIYLLKCNNEFTTTYTSNESINIYHSRYQERKSKERYTNCRRIEREEMRNRTHPVVGKRRKTNIPRRLSLPHTAVYLPTDARRILKLSYTRTCLSYHKHTVTVALSRHEENRTTRSGKETPYKLQAERKR